MAHLSTRTRFYFQIIQRRLIISTSTSPFPSPQHSPTKTERKRPSNTKCPPAAAAAAVACFSLGRDALSPRSYCLSVQRQSQRRRSDLPISSQPLMRGQNETKRNKPHFVLAMSRREMACFCLGSQERYIPLSTPIRRRAHPRQSTQETLRQPANHLPLGSRPRPRLHGLLDCPPKMYGVPV